MYIKDLFNEMYEELFLLGIICLRFELKHISLESKYVYLHSEPSFPVQSKRRNLMMVSQTAPELK